MAIGKKSTVVFRVQLAVLIPMWQVLGQGSYVVYKNEHHKVECSVLTCDSAME